MNELMEIVRGICCPAVCLWVIVMVAILIDLWDALYTARVLHTPVMSHRLRKTLGKFCEYWRVLLLALLMDLMGGLFPQYQLPYVSILMSVGLVCIEGKSVMEHAKARKSRTKDLPEVLEEVAKRLRRVADAQESR